MLDFTISNIGKIKNAHIELKGITVVAGLNGSGKSTIAKSIFAATNSRKNIYNKIRNDKESDIVDAIKEWLESDKSDWHQEDELSVWDFSWELAAQIDSKCAIDQADSNNEKVRLIVKQFCDGNQINSTEEGIQEICDQICEIVNRNTISYIEFFVNKYYQNVFRSQINHIAGNSIGDVTYLKNETDKRIVSKVRIEDNELSFVGMPLLSQQENAIYIETHSVLDACEGYIVRQNRQMLRDRTTLPTRELIDYLFEEKELSFAEQQKVEKNKEIIEKIVSEVTHGYLQKNMNGRMEFVDQDIHEIIAFSNMSSGIKIFSILQKLLTNGSMKANDILIVDEPEVNLHLKWQVTLAEIMVRIHKELGVYIIVNSHSPYFIRAIQVKMAEYECKSHGKYYFMEEDADGVTANDVTANVERIYSVLYQPLELL